MKKIILFLLFVLLNQTAFASYIDKQIEDAKNTAKYNTVRIHKQNFSDILEIENEISNSPYKDPGLIVISEPKPIDSKLYKEKMAKDEEIYKTKIKKDVYKQNNTININNPYSVDFYNIYRVTERLIRANNLDYINWRIVVLKSLTSNAFAFDGNSICITTAIYDALYGNDAALAFVIGHEMAHHIYGHAQRKIEERYKTIKTAPLAAIPIAGPIIFVKNEVKRQQSSRVREYMADAEALKLLITAGYSPQEAMSAITFLMSQGSIDTIWSSHPESSKRLESLQENARYIDPNWVSRGQYNLYKTKVLPCKKSSDRTSIIISKSANPIDFYKPENVEECITRVAYMSYKKGYMEDAAKYFSKLAEIKQDYISYLYLSYANQYLYQQTCQKDYYLAAKKAIITAETISPDNKYVKEQALNLKNRKKLKTL